MIYGKSEEPSMCLETSNDIMNCILWNIKPVRIEPSVEGGIAIVYRNENKFFNKKELFIEVYEDGSFIMMLHKNYKRIIRIEEFYDIEEDIINDFVDMLLNDKVK
jgi:hypothetical protein